MANENEEVKQQRAESATQLRASLVKLAQGSLEPGIIHEPRAYYDHIELNQLGQITAGAPEVFKNGEDFPVRITHMIAAMSLTDQDGAVFDPRFIQRVGVRWVFHNQMYMNPIFNALPAWANKVTAGPSLIDFSNCAWKFDVPFILSVRDTLEVEIVNAFATPEEPARQDVTLSGIGLLSGRPYLLSGDVTVTNQQRTRFDPTFFRNDGSEPIICTDLGLSTSHPEDVVNAGNFIETVAVQIRQAGNGTNANWFRGPEPNPQLIPASLLSITSGRSIVHRFPGDGLMWEPGEGVTLQAQALGEFTAQNPFLGILDIALAGYITVT